MTSAHAGRVGAARADDHVLAGARGLWQENFGRAEADHAEVANAIAAFEPVLMAADPRNAAQARRLCGDGVEVVEIPLDDSWARDSGPIFVTDEDGDRAGVQFGFNGWGEKFVPVGRGRAVRHAGARASSACRAATPAHFVLEGGSISVDGEGTLITTEQCLFEEHRNPRLAREQIEAELREQLGAERVVWLGLGLVEDGDTDGHVDNICAFIAPGRAVLQTVRDEANPNYEHCQENLRRLRDAGMEVDRAAVAARTSHDEEPRRGRPVHELLRLQRRADRPRPAARRPTTRRSR